jgi:APA family basic amino acid/polyamine antiporter
VCTYISNRGSQESSLFNQVFTLAKLVILGFIIIMAAIFFDFSNYTPLLSQHHPEQGVLGICVGATLVFYAYLGFDIIPAVAEEAKNPKKDIPRAIIHQVLYVIVVYILVAFFVNGVARLENFQGETAIALAFEARGHPWVAGVIYLCAFLGITASAFINMVG